MLSQFQAYPYPQKHLSSVEIAFGSRHLGNRATRQRDNKATRQPENRVTGQPGNKGNKATTSEVTPLLKEGDHKIANNNRPVSLLPVALKGFERVTLIQLTTSMTNKKRLTKHQSGKRKLQPSETFNVMITDKALEAMDAKKLTFEVLLDLSKAFDSLDHSKLLAKLKTLGAGSTALEWFGSYLSGRQQYVRIGAETSSLGVIAHGVPQGSILGLALFTIYIKDQHPEIWFSGIICRRFKTLFAVFCIYRP